MSCYIRFKFPNDLKCVTSMWNVGHQHEDIEILGHHWHSDFVLEIEADGKELNSILDSIDGVGLIPVLWDMKRSVRWFGDHAKFIFANVICNPRRDSDARPPGGRHGEPAGEG